MLVVESGSVRWHSGVAGVVAGFGVCGAGRGVQVPVEFCIPIVREFVCPQFGVR